MTTPEFSRPYRLDMLGEEPRAVSIEADADERRAIAARFRLAAVEALAASATLVRAGTTVAAEGRITAAVVQQCVATGAPIAAQIDAPFSLRFIPAGEPAAAEIELSEGDCDTIDYVGGAIDLGEAVAETLALALDPFPRKADADDVLRSAGVLREGEAGPFAALKALLGKGEG